LGTLISAYFWDNAPSLFQENLSLECVWLRLSYLAFTQESIKKIINKNTKILDTLLGNLKTSCNGCQLILSCVMDHPGALFLAWLKSSCSDSCNQPLMLDLLTWLKSSCSGSCNQPLVLDLSMFSNAISHSDIVKL